MNTTTTWGSVPAMDPAKMIAEWRKLLDGMTQPPFYASSKLLPTDKAITFKHERRDYLGAHPDFWKKVPTIETPVSPWSAVTIRDLDVDSTAHQEFFDAMAAVTAPKLEPLRVMIAPGETIAPGDWVTFDRDTGKLRRSVAGKDPGLDCFRVPAGARVTDDGYLEIPR